MGTVEFRMDADEARAVQAFQRVIQKQREAERQFGRTTKSANRLSRESERAGRRGRKAGNDLASAFGLAVGPIGAATAAVGAIVKVLRESVELSQQASRSLTNLAGTSTKRLVQIAEGPQDLARLQGIARQFSESQGVPLQRAEELVFTAGSLGIEDQVKDAGFFERIGSLQAGMDAFGFFQRNFNTGGRKPVTSLRQVLNQVLVGAKESRLSFEEIGPASAKAAQSVASVGGSHEELLAMLSVVAQATASGEEGATAIRSLATQIRKSGMGGQGIMGVLAGDLTAEQIEDLTSESRSQVGFGIIRGNMDEIRRRQRLIEEAGAATGTSGSEIEIRRRMLRGSSIAAALDKQRQEARLLNVGMERFGSEQAEFDARLAAMTAHDIEQGRSGFARSLRRWKAQFDRFMGADPDTAFGVPFGPGNFEGSDLPAGPSPKTDFEREAREAARQRQAMLEELKKLNSSTSNRNVNAHR